MALGMVVCSLIPILLFFWIDYTEFHYTVWVHRSYVLPHGALVFKHYYQLGLILPVLTAGVSSWLVSGKLFTVTRFAWIVLPLVVLHLFWLSFGLLALYSINQKFVVGI